MIRKNVDMIALTILLAAFAAVEGVRQSVIPAVVVGKIQKIQFSAPRPRPSWNVEDKATCFLQFVAGKLVALQSN